MEIEFNPTSLAENFREVKWVSYRGKPLESLSMCASAQDVAMGKAYKLSELAFRDPDFYVAGNLHKHLAEWEQLGANEEVLGWLKYGVNVNDYFKHFKGNFKGKAYDSNLPQRIFLYNASICKGFKDFIIEALSERVQNGSMSVWGKVGEVEPPFLVMPLTVEPSKPRLCHDERYLNLWIKDLPFVLDTLKDVPRIVPPESCMTTIDDKSGYDHIFLSENSRKYFGVQFGGWYFVYNTLPFGFKASAYIYHTTGLVATSYCRNLGIPCLQYIDDRLIGALSLKGFSNQELAERALYIVCSTLIKLGYFVGLKKSLFIPSHLLKFLGLIIDSVRQTFLIPKEKRASFAVLRSCILEKQDINLLTLQKFAGKCISFMLAVPAAKLFTREVHRAISLASKNSKSIRISKDLREEIEYWNFLDNWEGCVPWKQEKHLQINLATDASSFRWGGTIGNEKILGDFFSENDKRPIHLKEAEALYQTINLMKHDLENHRVDAYVDNQAVVAAWEGEGCKCSELNKFVKMIFFITREKNIDLKVQYIPSCDNPADAESRKLSLQDCKLSINTWDVVQKEFGPHSVDLMALDSNAMLNEEGKLLRHFTPYPMAQSDGVNLFAQDISSETLPYVFPPFCLIAPVLKFLREQKPPSCTFVYPHLTSLPSWWPTLKPLIEKVILLGKKGDKHIILGPTKNGFSPRSLSHDLYAAKLVFH